MGKKILKLVYSIEIIWFARVYFKKNHMTIGNNISIGEIVSAIILTITAIIVWKYTRETQKSNEIQEKPILNLYLREDEDGPILRKILKLRNVGKGPAYNISISGFKTAHVTYFPYFNQSNFILESGGDEKSIVFNVEKHDGGIELFKDYARYLDLFIGRIFPRDTKPQQREFLMRTAGIFLINYDGVSGKSYHSIFRLYPKTWPMINIYDVAIEFISNGSGKSDLVKAKGICSSKRTTLGG